MGFLGAKGFPHFAGQIGPKWLIGFVERLTGDKMTLGILLGLAILLMYTLLQYVSAWVEGRVIRQGLKAKKNNIFYRQ